ncbi:hypothetical protein [Streptosporangium roseum]|uniref:hypothetical protein n=1 Tax=Streptosporangium roseum TaxID=2001 RepID=UPI003321D212
MYAPLCDMAVRFAGGPLTDDPNQRRTIAVGGYATTVVLGAATAVATSVWQVGVLRPGLPAACASRPATRRWPTGGMRTWSLGAGPTRCGWADL